MPIPARPVVRKSAMERVAPITVYPCFHRRLPPPPCAHPELRGGPSVNLRDKKLSRKLPYAPSSLYPMWVAREIGYRRSRGLSARRDTRAASARSSSRGPV
jgi:hypothetical protein